MKKILLIHGWNYRNYTNLTKEKDAWHNREEFVEELSKNYEVYKINLPGFCGRREPKVPWDLEDYANFIHDYIVHKKLNIDYILGYSFGGAVAISYYLKYHQKEKIILVSPAIIRNADNSKKFVKTPKFLDGIRERLRDFYIIHIVKTNEMRYGTPFLRGTYQIIVRKDLKEDLLKIPSKDMLIIYGENDDMVNPKKVIDFLPKEYQSRVSTIKNGDHNIGQTHPQKICEIIKKKI